MILEINSKHTENKSVVGSGQHGFMKAKSFLINLTAFHDDATGMMHEVRAGDVVYLEFSKDFNTVSHNIFIDKLMKYRLVKWTVSCIKKLLNGQVQSSVISSICDHSSWRLVTTCISQSLILGLMIFNIFINDLVDRAECTLSKFSNDTKQGREADAPDGLADWNLKQFNKGKCKVPYLGKNNSHTSTGQPVGRQLCREGSASPSEHQVEQEPAIFPCDKEGLCFPELHYEEPAGRKR